MLGEPEERESARRGLCPCYYWFLQDSEGKLANIFVSKGWMIQLSVFQATHKKDNHDSLFSTPSERQNTAYCFTCNNSEHCGVVCVSQYAYETKMFRPVYLACGLGM